MTSEEFRSLTALQDCRVRMIFKDGDEVIATLLSVSTDMDGSRHLIYDNVEWSAIPCPEENSGAQYASGDELVACSVVVTR